MPVRAESFQVPKPGILLLVIVASLIGITTPAKADWINLSGAENARNIAEIRINGDHVKIELEILPGDLGAFERLIPDEYLKDIQVERPPQDVRLQRFSEDNLQVIADGGRLTAEMQVFEPRLRKKRTSPYAGLKNPYTGQPIPGPPEDKRVLYVKLIYPFAARPGSLTFVPPLDAAGVNRVTLGFMTYHLEVPIHDFKYLSEPATVKLDWTDPWYSAFNNRALKRSLTGGVMSFLYIEPFEVRHEILVRVKDLSAWLDLGLRGTEFIEADENDSVRKRVGDFFLEHENVIIDGERLRPILDRTAFVKYSPTASVFVDQPEQLTINTAMVGVIITYLTTGMPQEVLSRWDLWSERIRKVPTNAIDPAGGFPSYVTPDDNEQQWKNYLKKFQIPTVQRIEAAESLHRIRVPLGSLICGLLALPVLSLVWGRRSSPKPPWAPATLAILLIGAAVILYPHWNVTVARPGSIASRITDQQGKALLENLLKNVYRACDFRSEEDAYDKLAISVSGDLLRDLYLQNRTSFRVKQAGGAQAKVKEIEVLDVQVEDGSKRPRGVCLHSRWTAMGTVGHWGHIHSRQNHYEALVTVEIVDGSWKIIDLEMLEQRRTAQYDKGIQPLNEAVARQAFVMYGGRS